VLQEKTVSYFHKKEQVTKTLEVQRREGTIAPAPWFDAVEPLGLI
jgi:hypothetical protein